MPRSTLRTRIDRHLLACSAIAGVGLAALPAEAAVVLRPGGVITLPPIALGLAPETSGPVPFNYFTGIPANVDVAFMRNYGGFGNLRGFAVNNARMLVNATSVVRLSMGALISTSAPGTFAAGQAWVTTFSGGRLWAPYSGARTGYAAFSFTSFASTMPFFGWIHLRIGAFNNSATVLSFAYQTRPGVPVLAGSTLDLAPVPEPGTAGLACIALGAAGWAAWRRRRDEDD